MKKIKFALLINNKPCRSLEDIRENFNINDILDYFDKGILEKWLTAQNLNELNEKVLAIDKNADIFKKVNSLIKIFHEDENETTIKEMSKEATYMIEFENKRKDDLEFFRKNDFKEKEVIDNYFKNYEDIIELIIEKKDDYEFIKSSIKNISDNFMNAFKYNYFNLFSKLHKEDNYFSILLILINKNTRKYFIEDEDIMKALNEMFSHTYGSSNNIKYRFGLYKEKLANDHYLTSKLNIYSKNTKKHFSTVVENKKCLILHIDKGCSVTSFKDKSKEYDYNDINNKFLILDGITYMGSSESAQLVYMEI